MEDYLDKTLSPKHRALDLLSKMSIEERMAQINGVWYNHGDIKEATKHGIGQVSTLEFRNIDDLQKLAQEQIKTQKEIMERSEHHIPAVFHMEGLCGAYVPNAVSFPSAMNRASSWNPEMEERLGEIVARQERAVGVTQTLAPVLDISRDARMGRMGESYGEDPTLAAALGAGFTKGVQGGTSNGQKSECIAKHFLAFHNSQGAIHGANCEIGERQLREIYAKPFQAAITQSKLRGIMPCYDSLNGKPVSASKNILTDLLREEMGFDGVVAADYSSIANTHNTQHCYESMTETGLACLEAGLDVELPSCEAYNEELGEWFADYKVSPLILDGAVLRVLEAKFRMGLFENPFAMTGQALEQEMVHGDEQQISRESARESLILLKNENQTLPINIEEKKIKKIAVIGCHGGNARHFFGGYTHVSMTEAIYAAANSLAGVDASNEATDSTIEGPSYQTIPGTQIQNDETPEFDEALKRFHPDCKSLYEEMRDRFAPCGVEVTYSYGYPIAGNDTSHFPKAIAAVKEADLVIMTLGGKHGSGSVASMGEGVDATDINLPQCQDEFIQLASQYGKPLVGVHFNGRPISSDIADAYLDAIIEAWNPSEMGAPAICDVLLGIYNPSGKLPLSVARNAGQLPIYYNHPYGSSYHQGDSIGFKNYVDMLHTPRYFFGYGLSYTTYEYSNLQLNKKEVLPDEDLEVSLTVANTGNVTGTEIVQLYLSDRYASMTRPVMELAGFARITLEPGEKKQVVFMVSPSQMAFLDESMKWKIEAGDIDVRIGASSDDIRLEDSYKVTEDLYIDGKTRSFYAQVK